MPADQRRKQLLEFAREVFAERGFHATAMDEIAERAGVTKPVLYQHFPNKRALYIELLTDTGDQLLRMLATATGAASSGRERVELGFRAYFRFVIEHRTSFRLLFGSAIRTDDEFVGVVNQVGAAAADLIAELIDIEASEEHRRILADALVGMAEAVGRRATDDEHGDPIDADRLSQWIAELAWFGLRGVRAEIQSQLP